MHKDGLSQEEILRYDRHLKLSEFGVQSQLKLKNSSALVVGAGGLGTPVLQYLTAAGMGTIGLVEPDKVAVSNLQRQVLYNTEEIGLPKTDIVHQKLSKLNPHVQWQLYPYWLDAQNAYDIIASYDIIIDCSDNFPTRYLVNDVCVALDKTFVFGAIYKFEGQVAVFNGSDPASNIRTATYRCLFPDPPLPGEIPNCAEAGVLGVLPALVGSVQAAEAIKVLTGVGAPLYNQLWHIDLLTLQTYSLRIRRLTPPRHTQTDLNLPTTMPIQTIDAEALFEKIASPDIKITLIDVRELFEYEICHLPNSILIPLHELPAQVAKIPQEGMVVVYCHHGIRSAHAIQYLQQDTQATHLYNLAGGIDAWAATVDPQMARY